VPELPNESAQLAHIQRLQRGCRVNVLSLSRIVSFAPTLGGGDLG
jgi:hypothetical protein